MHQKTKNQTKSRLILVIVFSFVALLAVAQLFVSNRLATLGKNLEQEKIWAENIATENRVLEQELGEKESLIVIAEEAQKLGFEKVNSIYYLVPQVPVAMK